MNETFIKGEWYLIDKSHLLKYDYTEDDKFWATKYISIEDKHLCNSLGFINMSNSTIRKATIDELKPYIYLYSEEFNNIKVIPNVLVSFNDQVNSLIQNTNTLTNKINLIQ